MSFHPVKTSRMRICDKQLRANATKQPLTLAPASALWRGVIFLALSTVCYSQAAQPSKPNAEPRRADRGGATFAASCAGCHGLDGRGGDRAPNIVEGRVSILSDAEISGIIKDGITETGMPSFHSLADTDIQALVSYLRALQGVKQAVGLPSDIKRGQALFFSKAGCSTCHTAAGEGGFMASDLSGYARTHSRDETRIAITSPKSGDQRVLTATVTTADGEKLIGRMRNEDNFSLQLQTPDGVFHSLTKSEMKSVEYSSRSSMPSNYGSTLSSDELDDLVTYIASLATRSESESPKVRAPDDSPEEER